MSTKPQSIADLTSILERMHPDRLLMVRHGARLEEEVVAALIPALVATHDPAKRLGNIEFLLLLLHEAREVDAPHFLKTVFLPWVGLQRRTRPQRARIGEAFTNLPEAYTEDDAAHIATAIYRPLVADIFDPHLTLLTAAYAFIAGDFIDIRTSNLSASEFNKAEFICARIRESGGPADLLDGYDAAVRNALSHTGSEGLRFEPGAIIFRAIRRGPTPKVEVRRWMHDELHMHVLQLLEVLVSIDVAIEIFGLDCLELLPGDADMIGQVALHALTPAQRADLRASLGEARAAIRALEVPLAERVSRLAPFLLQACAERDMPRPDISRDGGRLRLAVSAVALGEDKDTVARAARLMRYTILAREIFADLFDQFSVCTAGESRAPLTVELPGAALDDYANERAGFADLLSEAQITLGRDQVRIAFDDSARRAAEDAVGRPFPASLDDVTPSIFASADFTSRVRTPMSAKLCSSRMKPVTPPRLN